MASKQKSSSSLALWLAAAFALLIVYASLHPFKGWRIPPVTVWTDAFVLAWPRWSGWFDEWVNGIGYVPLGLFLFIGLLRTRGSVWVATLWALLGCAVLSVTMEQIQQFLPMRVPSLKDWALNTLGAFAGLLLGAVLHFTGMLQRWDMWRNQWFHSNSTSGMAVLLLWPFALLFPTPLPFVLGYPWTTGGQVPWFDSLGLTSPWRDPVHWLAPVGLMLPALMVQLMVRERLQKGFSSIYILILGCLSLCFSTGLSVGFDHSLSWLNFYAALGMAVVAVLAVLWVWVPASFSVLVLMLLTLLMQWGLNDIPPDVYYTVNLNNWEQGEFVRFHGIAQWLGWLWPYLSMVWLIWYLLYSKKFKAHKDSVKFK